MDSLLVFLHIVIKINWVFIYKVDAVCSQGSSGPSCHKENIALNRSTTQSSVFETFSSGLAVDGNSNMDLSAGSCTHTTDDSQSSLTVLLDPRKAENITNVTLYLQDRFASRYKDLRVTVDGVLCGRGNITNTEDTRVAAAPTPNPVLLRCHQPLQGHNVTVHVNNSYLSLCEVQIWVCEDGWFGDDCNESCRCNDTSEVCDKLTGYCRSGCSSGWEGRGCQIACSNNTYGSGCSLTCSHCSPCDPVTGVCSGCDSGRETGRCDVVCGNNTYGPGCAMTCGHCLNSSPCDPVTGVCSKGCDPGWETGKCDRPCSTNTYGPGCSVTCGHCLNSSPCDPVTGLCSSGCDPGWEAGKCDRFADANAEETVVPFLPYLVWAIVATVLAMALLLVVILLILHLRRHHRKTSNTQGAVTDVDLIETTHFNPYEDLQRQGQDNPYQELDHTKNKSGNENINP